MERLLATTHDADEAGRITCPVLCLVGERDPLLPPAAIRAIADLLPDARFVEVRRIRSLALLRGSRHLERRRRRLPRRDRALTEPSRRHTGAVDQLVAVGDIEVPARLRARVRRVVHHDPGAPLEPLIADLRTHVPRRVLVLGRGPGGRRRRRRAPPPRPARRPPHRRRRPGRRGRRAALGHRPRAGDGRGRRPHRPHRRHADDAPRPHRPTTSTARCWPSSSCSTPASPARTGRRWP